MELTRQIDVFNRDNEELVQEILVENFNLERVTKVFDIPSEDPLMYNPYEITSKNCGIFPGVNFDFNKYQYYLACYQ